MDVIALDSLLRAIPSSQELAPDFPQKFFTKALTRNEGLW